MSTSSERTPTTEYQAGLVAGLVRRRALLVTPRERLGITLTVESAYYSMERRPFVTRVVQQFAKQVQSAKAPILDNLVDFVLTTAVEQDAEWNEHMRDEEWFDLPTVEKVLVRCLQRVHAIKPLDDLTEADLDGIVLPTFVIVLQRWKCCVPFILC